jgi:hypothetical protein
MIHLRPEVFTPLRAGGKDAVLAALQQAVELEHATIPVYLYALYSMDWAKNAAVAGVVRSVVVQEMLHMTLAANVLNALGGRPVIDSPGFIPVFPGPLPGGVEAELTVHLAPLSMAQVQAFMTIEEPEDPLNFPTAEAFEAAPPRTIGQFYTLIKQQVAALGDGAFTGDRRRQVGPELMHGSIVVTNVATATKAIDLIIEQGEGTTQSPLEAATGDVFAHYYRFAEIYHGKKLIKNPNAGPNTPPDQRYIYAGEPITLDPAGVFPVPTDPKAAGYPPGSAGRIACDTFNYTYTSLLKSLHTTFNGRPADLVSAIGLMMSLKVLARNMMSGTSPAGVNVGPSFEYQPVNPG